MPDLDKYTIVSFEQGVAPVTEYVVPWPHNQQVAFGYSCALVIEYYRRRCSGDQVNTGAVVQHLIDNFPIYQKLPISKLSMGAGVDYVKELNRMAPLTGAKFTNESPDAPLSDNKENIKTRISIAQGAQYAIVFCDTKASNGIRHMIGIQYESANRCFVVFDPNLGIMQVSGSDGLSDFIDAYCEKYATTFQMNFDAFYLLRIDWTPTLSDYLVALIDQDTIITAKYQIPSSYKETATSGICCALVLEYYKRLAKGDNVAPGAMVQHLSDQFPVLIQRQQISDTSFHAGLNDVQTLNEMARHTGLQFTNESPDQPKCDNRENIKTRISIAKHGAYVLIFEGTKRGKPYAHIISIQLAPAWGIIVFDPNFGIMHVPGSIGDFVDLYSGTYDAGSEVTMNSFWLLRCDTVETARDKFERGFPVPQVPKKNQS